MSTTTEMPENVYDVRGRRMQVDYDEDAHTVTIHSPDLGEEIDETTDPQAQLEDIGVYTRIQAIEEIARNYITIALKPAASVELRGPTENSDKLHTLMARPVSKQFDGSTITKRRGKYGYTATCSMELMEAVGLDYDTDGDEDPRDAAMYAEIRDGALCLRVEPGEAPHSMSARIDSTGLIGVPNGLASAANLDGHGVDWEVVDDGEALLGTTTFEPDPVDMPEEVDDPEVHPEDVHYRAAISFVQQEWEGHTQTHFTVYVPSKLMSLLNWGSDFDLYEREEKPTREEVLKDYVDIRLVNLEGELGLYLSDDIRPQFIDNVDVEDASDSDDDLWDASVRTAPCVRKLYRNSKNGQTTFSFPHSLAHALEFTDEWRRVRDISDDDTEDLRLTEDIARGQQVKWAYAGDGDTIGQLNHPSDIDDVVAEEDVDAWLDEHGVADGDFV